MMSLKVNDAFHLTIVRFRWQVAPTVEASAGLKDDLERCRDGAAVPVGSASTADEKEARSLLRYCCGSVEPRMTELEAAVSHDWRTTKHHEDSSNVAVVQ